MAEFSFLGTWEDSWEIVASIFALGDVSMIPDCYYTKPEPLMFDSLNEELKKIAIERRRFFLVSKLYSTQPLILTMQDSGKRAGQYFISGNKGGPCLELTLPACYLEDDLMLLNFGVIRYAREYLDAANGKWISPPRQLKDSYKATVACIKRCLVKRSDGNVVWIGKRAGELIDHGGAKLVG